MERSPILESQIEYFRTQAQLSLKLASQTSDLKLAEKLRAEAARFHEAAADLESQRTGAKTASQGPSG